MKLIQLSLDEHKGYALTEDYQIVNTTPGSRWYMKPRKPVSEYGYVRVAMNGRLTLLHRVIAKEFVPNPDNKPFINHKDGNKTNNHPSNLEWVTNKENLLHAHSAGLCDGKKVKVIGTSATGKEFLFDTVRDAAKLVGGQATNIVKTCRGHRERCGGFSWRYA